MQVLLAFPVAGLLAAASGPGGVADERPIRSIGFLVLDWDLSQLAFRRAPGARMPGPGPR
jgi:hypothetical protein